MYAPKEASAFASIGPRPRQVLRAEMNSPMALAANKARKSYGMLSKLPSEIRDMVYRYVLEDFYMARSHNFFKTNDIDKQPFKITMQHVPQADLNILLVSRIIHQEARSILCKEKSFNLGVRLFANALPGATDMSNWDLATPLVSKAYLSSMMNVEVPLIIHCYKTIDIENQYYEARKFFVDRAEKWWASLIEPRDAPAGSLTFKIKHCDHRCIKHWLAPHWYRHWWSIFISRAYRKFTVEIECPTGYPSLYHKSPWELYRTADSLRMGDMVPRGLRFTMSSEPSNKPLASQIGFIQCLMGDLEERLTGA